MTKYHPPQVKVDTNNYELSQKVLGGLNGNIFHSTLVDVTPAPSEAQDLPVKVKLNPDIRKEGIRLGNRSSIPVFLNTQKRLSKLGFHNVKKYESAQSSPSKYEKSNGNPFDVNLVDMKESILF